MTPARAWLTGLLAIGVLARLPIILAPSRIEGGDEPLYTIIARQFASGEGFATAGDFRTAGYPVFMAAADVLPGPMAANVHAVQHVLGLGLVALVFGLVLRRGGLPAAVVAAALLAISPLVLSLEHVLNADLLFSALAVIAVGLAVRGCEATGRRRLAWLALAGITIGIATHVKPTGQVLIAAVPVVLGFATRDWRAALVGTAVAGLAALVVLAPWLARNATQYGHASVSGAGQVTLFHRLFEVDRRPVPTDEPYGAALRSLQVEAAPEPLYARAVVHLAGRGLSQSRVLEVTGDLAKAAIRDAPLRYLANSVALIPRGVADLVRRPYYDRRPTYVDERLEASRLPGASAYDVVYKVGRAAVGLWVVLALIGSGLAMAMSRVAPGPKLGLVAYGSAWLALVAGTALTHGGTWRYSAAAAPLLLIALTGPAAAFWEGRRRPVQSKLHL